MELDQLYKRTGRRIEERLAFLEKHIIIVEKRDDLYLERITLYNQLGHYEKAKELIESHIFHPWEGGEGKLTGQYGQCHIGLAKKALTEGNFNFALELLRLLNSYPENLGEGRLFGAQENHIHYYLGCSFEGLGDKTTARIYFETAAKGNIVPSQAFFYNDQQSDMIYYQGLALIKLGDLEGANSKFNKLIDYEEKHIFKKIRIDYFAVSLPDLLIWEDDIDKRNLIHCHYLIGLGLIGKGEVKKALKHFKKVLSLDKNHLGTLFHLKSEMKANVIF